MERDAFDRDALDRLADVLMEDIAATSGNDLLAEVEEDYGDASLLARAFDEGLPRAEAVALRQSNKTAIDNAVSVATEIPPSEGATAREEPPHPAQPVGVVRSGWDLRASFTALVAGFTATLRSHPEIAAFAAVLLLFVVLTPANLRTNSTVGPAPSSPGPPSTCRDGGVAGCSPAPAARDGVRVRSVDWSHAVSDGRCEPTEEPTDNPSCADAGGIPGAGEKPPQPREDGWRAKEQSFVKLRDSQKVEEAELAVLRKELEAMRQEESAREFAHRQAKPQPAPRKIAGHPMPALASPAAADKSALSAPQCGAMRISGSRFAALRSNSSGLVASRGSPTAI